MACSQTLTGIKLDCATSMGGIVKVYLANYQDNVFSYSTLTGATAEPIPNQITGVSSAVTWHEFNFRKGTGSMTSTLNVDDANAINYVSTEVVLQFGKMETTKRLAVAALALGGLVGVVKDANGIYWGIGASEPVMPSAGTGQTGTARTDGNYYQVTLLDNFDSYPMALDATSVATVLAHLADE